MALISLLHPSRSRPQKSFETTQRWIMKAGCETELIVSIDSNDPYKNEYLNKYGDTECTVICQDNKSVVEATNRAAKEAKGDVLLYLSDDFECFDWWGLDILKEFYKENRPLLLKVDDCLQDFHVKVLTIPIMNRMLYEKLEYFWNPQYLSMFVDEDLWWTCHLIGAMKFAKHLKFEHRHTCVGKAPNDETYRRSAANWDQGKAVFAQRKAQGFRI